MLFADSHRRTPTNARAAAARRGFSLMELLVVILIIALVMAILIPAIAGARRSAKNVQTGAMLQGLGTSAGQFITDNGRLPGAFSPGDMGHLENVAQGFSAMQNIMLDLAGGVTAVTAGPGIIKVGPRATGEVFVDLGQIGSTSGPATTKAYFNPDRGFYDIEVGRRSIGQVGNATNVQLPSLVDAFGMPILAWSNDEQAASRFAARNSSGPEPSRFYWASNACFLNADALSARGLRQSWLPNAPCSMLGFGVGFAPQIEGTLEALLGDPSNPAKDYSDSNRKSAGPRAPLTFHSAGPDGYYLGSQEIGGKSSIGTANTVLYSRDLDAARAPFFDDVLVTAGK